MSLMAPASTRTVKFGPRDLACPGPHLGQLRESNELLHDAQALRERMHEDGYLFIRGLHDRDQVLQVRRDMLQKLAADGHLANDAPLMDGVIPSGRESPAFDQGKLKNLPSFLSLVSAPRIMNFFADYLGGAATTFDYKWLRVVAQGGFTGAHFDVVYMGRGTHNLWTCWTPIGDVDLAMGPLAVVEGSHRAPGFARLRETYGRMDVDRDHVEGWFSKDPLEIVERFGGRWLTADFRAGDAIVFSIWTMHASLTNTTRRVRISSDTRYQLAADAMDERWIGEKPMAHYAWNTPGKNVSMEEARKAWGV